MSVSLDLSIAEFNEALDLIVKKSPWTNSHVVKFTAGQVVKKIVSLTPIWRGKGKSKMNRIQKKRAERYKGTARAGWYPAWKRLEAWGTPNTDGNTAVLSEARGTFVDRMKAADPSFTLINDVSYAGDLGEKKKIISRALQWQLRYMRKFVEREYGRLLKPHSAKAGD